MTIYSRKVFRQALMAMAAAVAFLMPAAAANAAEGYSTANVNMRSGPSTRYPAVTVIPAGTPVEIHGCLSDVFWCDVSFYNGRGWVSGNYVQVDYRQERVLIEPDYYGGLGIPTVTFEIGRYWDNHYRGRNFYRDRDRYRGDNYYRRDNNDRDRNRVEDRRPRRDQVERHRDRNEERVIRRDRDNDGRVDRDNRRDRQRIERRDRNDDRRIERRDRSDDRRMERRERNDDRRNNRQEHRSERRDDNNRGKSQLKPRCAPGDACNR